MRICVWYMCMCAICNICVLCICINVYTCMVCVYCIGLYMHVYCVFAGDLDYEAHVEVRE